MTDAEAGTPDQSARSASGSTPAQSTWPFARRGLLMFLLALTTGFGYLAVQSVNFPDSSAAVVALMWTFAISALVSLVAALGVLTKVWDGMTQTTFALVSVSIGALTLGYFVLYDLVLTPERQWFWDSACFGAAAALLALSARPFLRWKTNSSPKQFLALLTTVPLVTLFGAWYTYIFSPTHTRPVVVMTVDLKTGRAIATPGTSTGMIPIVGAISVENAGTVDAGITASLLKIVETPLNDGLLPNRSAKTLSTAITSSGALEPFGGDVKQVSTLVATSDPAANVAYLDEVTPSGSFIESGETLHRTFATAIPDPTEPVVLTMKAEIFLVNEAVQTFVPCDRRENAAESLRMQPSNAAAGGAYACFQAQIPSRTPIGKLFFDHPDIKTFFVVDDQQVPGSATGEMFQSFSTNGADIVGDQAAINNAFEKLRKYSAAIMTESETQLVVA